MTYYNTTQHNTKQPFRVQSMPHVTEITGYFRHYRQAAITPMEFEKNIC